jgi:NAD(P)-dependent dehydrogenase (short-subunit alcohol dehydrogenase family)
MGPVAGKVTLVTGAIDTSTVHSTIAQLGLPSARKKDPSSPAGIERPLDVANAVLYLASDESRCANGAEIMILNALRVQQAMAEAPSTLPAPA